MGVVIKPNEVVCPECKTPLHYFSAGHMKRWQKVGDDGNLETIEEAYDTSDEFLFCPADDGHDIPFWLYRDAGERTGEVNELGIPIVRPLWKKYDSEEEYEADW